MGKTHVYKQQVPNIVIFTNKKTCALNFSMLNSFGCDIMSLLSSFGRGMPCLLWKIMKIIFIWCWKAYIYELWGWPCTYFCFTRWYFMIKTVQFQHSNICKVDKMIYNSISDICPMVFAPKLSVKWSFFWAKTSFKLYKMPGKKIESSSTHSLILTTWNHRKLYRNPLLYV